MEDTYVRFEPNPLKMQAWRDRFITASTSSASGSAAQALAATAGQASAAASPSELYAKAIPVFQDWKKKLLASRVWKQTDDHDDGGGLPPGMLFVLEMTERSPLLLKRSSTQSYTSFLDANNSNTNGSNSAAAGREGAVLALPSELSAFIEYQTQLEEILQDPLLFYPYLDKHHELVLEAFDESDVPASKVLTDVFYLLQLLIPGMLIIVHDQLWFGDGGGEEFRLKAPGNSRTSGHARSTTTANGASRNGSSFSQNSTGSSSSMASATLTRIRRGIPPAKWISQNRTLLDGIFGSDLTRTFESAAKDPRRALWTTIYSADGQRLEHGHALNASEAMEEIDIPRMARVPLHVTPTPGRGAHTLYADFTRKSQTL